MKSIRVLLLLVLFTHCSPRPSDTTSWCNQPLRPQLNQYIEIPTRQPWFRVYEVGKGVYAIVEPYNFQEVISYLILGNEHNILFDTGMGMGSIKDVVAELSTLPLTVINSHTHYDHIGGNHEFDNILSVDTAYTRNNSTKGWPHQSVRQEVRVDAFCQDKLPGLDTAVYAIKPYADRIKGFLQDGDTIQLGQRTIEVLRVPGHTPDCIALLDRANGYLWTGDMYYEATIWLFFDGTDLDAYEKSIRKFEDLAPSLTAVFPAHNTPVADPTHLHELVTAFRKIIRREVNPVAGAQSGHPDDSSALTFQFEHFSFKIRSDAIH